MSPDQIALVQESFRQIVPMKDLAAKNFYDRLFELDPSLEPLFRTSPHEQGQKLMSALAAVVGGLDDWVRIEPVVRDLALRHVDYGVKSQHYHTVGEALLWTLEQGLGDTFTEEIKTAWATAYQALARTMIDAAKSRAA